MEELEEMMKGLEEEEAMAQMGEMDIVPQGHIESNKQPEKIPAKPSAPIAQSEEDELAAMMAL